MVKKIKCFLLLFLVFFLPAFIMRPVVVCLHNTSNLHSTPQKAELATHSGQEMASPLSTLHHIDREAPDVAFLVPCYSREKVPSLADNRLSFVVPSSITFQKSSLILRI